MGTKTWFETWYGHAVFPPLLWPDELLSPRVLSSRNECPENALRQTQYIKNVRTVPPRPRGAFMRSEDEHVGKTYASLQCTDICPYRHSPDVFKPVECAEFIQGVHNGSIGQKAVTSAHSMTTHWEGVGWGGGEGQESSTNAHYHLLCQKQHFFCVLCPTLLCTS